MPSAPEAGRLWRLTWLITALIMRQPSPPGHKARTPCRLPPLGRLTEADIACLRLLSKTMAAKGLDLSVSI